MPFALRPDAKIHYQVFGAADGPRTLVLGNGFFLDGTSFSRLSPAAEDAGVRLICWDARGHGLTRSSGSFTYWDAARDALAVMDSVGVESAYVGGLSQGGYSALRVALLAPDRVDGLVLMDTEASACSPDEVADYRQLFDAWFDDAVPLEALTSGLAPRLIGGTAADQQPWIDSWHTGDRRRWRDAADALMTRDSVEERLREIACPALVLRGEFDENCTQEKARRLAEGIPGAGQVRVIAAAGHGSAWTHADPVAEAVFAFLVQ